jgi:hypothetical protein
LSDIVRQRSYEFNDFSGGLNNFWDPSSIADNEVPYLINMEFTPNGALTSRPPIVDRDIPQPPGFVPPFSVSLEDPSSVELLGYYTSEGGKTFLIASTSFQTWALEITLYGFNGWIQIWDRKAVAMVQYANQVVMAGAVTGGARWMQNRPAVSTPANPVIDGATDTLEIPQMPALFSLVLFRERLLGSGRHGGPGETAIYWSDIISLDQPTGIYEWNSDSFVYVNRGDGQPITAMVADYNGLIIFKRNATYNFVYSDLPEEGQISLVQTNIGAQNKRSVAGYQNGFVVLHNRTLYKFQNNVYSPINSQRVRFNYKETVIVAGTSVSEAVSILGDRALVYTGGSLYSLNLLTGTWSEWETETGLGYLLEVPQPRGRVAPTFPFALGVAANYPLKIWYIQDSPISLYKVGTSPLDEEEVSGSEEFDCVMRTKIYDFEAPTEWKRMYWWSTDVAASGLVTGKIIPIGIPDLENTWDQMDQYTWDYFEQQTWDTLFFRDVTVSTDQDIVGEGPQRVALKMDRSVRFRRAFFELYLTCDGTPQTAPAQIFSLTPMIGLKAKMSKDVA